MKTTKKIILLIAISFIAILTSNVYAKSIPGGRTQLTDKNTTVTLTNSTNNYVYWAGRQIKPEIYSIYSKTDNHYLSKNEYTVSYKNNINPGTGTVIITINSDTYYGTINKNFTIKKGNIPATNKTTVNGLLYTSYADPVTYTGKALTPKIHVIYADMELKQGVDYKIVSKKNNTNVSSNKPTVTIQGIGGFTGTQDISFKITPYNISNCEHALGKTIIIYQAKEKSQAHPSLSLKMGNTTLSGSNYKCTYKNDNKTGTATITITANNQNFTGSKTVTYYIIDPDKTYARGDVNGDGKVTATDARLALRISSKLEPYVKAADLDGNGKVTAAEARKIDRYSAKLIKSL